MSLTTETTDSSSPFQILGNLNSGGMGKVYLAIKHGPVGARQLVVLKVPITEDSSEKWRSEFEDEARITAHLNHPNIARVIDWTELYGKPCIVAEYIQGFDLRQIIHHFNFANRHIPLYLVSQIMLQTCEAMQYIHNAKTIDGKPLNIVHRDIDPSNVMVADNGYVKIIDFGIAKNDIQKELTKPGIYKGKFAYLAPDIFQADKVDQRADIFSLGLVLFELLTGQKPRNFPQKFSLSAVVMSIKETRVPAPSSIVPTIPAVFDRIVAKATALEKSNRYRSMGELLMDIRKVSKKFNTGSDHTYIKQWLKKELAPLREARDQRLKEFQTQKMSDHYFVNESKQSTAIISDMSIGQPYRDEMRNPKIGETTIRKSTVVEPDAIRYGVKTTDMIHRTVKQANSRLIIGTLVSLFCIQTSALFVGIGVLRRPLELTPIPVNVHHTTPGVTASAPTNSNFILFIPADSPGKNELPTPVLGQHWPFASNILLSDLSKMERWNRQWRYKMAKNNEHRANVHSAKPKQSRVATSANKVVSKKSRIKSNRFFASRKKSELKKKRATRNTRLRQKQHAESRQAINTVNRRIAAKTNTSASDQKRSKSNRTRGKKNSAERLARNDR